MATMTMNQTRQSSPLPILVMAVVFAASAAIYCAHAAEKHGASAEAVRRCLENNDPLSTWVKMTDGRVIHVCKLDTGQYGIQIRDSSGRREITSMIKDKLKTLAQVNRYLENIGAVFVEGAK